MSISDVIVVMKLGVVQQVGKPQEIYDDPTNLFVAKFLGTPPINVFRGYVKDGKLCFGGNETPITEQFEVEVEVKGEDGTVTLEKKLEEKVVGYKYDGGVAVMDAPAELGERGVYVGVRPEGFEVDENGALECKLNNLEVMGRDSSIVSTHESSENPIIRSIIDSDVKVDTTAPTVKLSLKKHKVFVFDKQTEERIRF